MTSDFLAGRSGWSLRLPETGEAPTRSWARPFFRDAPALRDRTLDFAQDTVQYPVDKSAGFFASVSFSQIDGFIDGGLGRRIAAEPQFINGQPEDISIHRRHPLQPPVLRMTTNQQINVFLLFTNPLNQFSKEGIRRPPGGDNFSRKPSTPVESPRDLSPVGKEPEWPIPWIAVDWP